MGIEPTYQAWEARVLPLNYARVGLATESDTRRCGLTCQSFLLCQFVTGVVLIASFRFGNDFTSFSNT